MAVDMRKIEQEAPELVSLAKKSQFAVSKHGLDGQKAKVALLLDASASMRHLYRSGAVQAAAEKVLAVATQFDDDGDIDVFFFHNKCWYAGTLSISDYKGGIDRIFNGDFGGTEYGPAFKKVTEHFFKGGLFRSADRSVPVYVAFITDGDTQRRNEALKAAQESSENPIFFQSVGINPDPMEFEFIQNTLNNHGGKVDNFGFVTYPDITKVSDVDLLDGLLNEFPGALDKMRSAGTLK